MALEITDNNYKEILSEGKPVVIDFWAPWCGPCRALGPVIDQISQEMAYRLDVYKCNVDEEADLATQFRIVSIPTLILFKGGKAVHTIVGSMPKPALVAELEANL